jgi:NAD(P)-dependent dehydrogenase (short-subunit alcohol dehydrogenase family)
VDAAALLRPDLLAGRVVALGGGDALAPVLAALGARTMPIAIAASAEDAPERLAAPVRFDALVHDLRPDFLHGGAPALQQALENAWILIRGAAAGDFIPERRSGKVILIAPPPDRDDPACEALRAGAENLARTLSIEWSRYGITTVAITPGASTTDGELAALAAYLASPAGDYFSGARLALGEAVPA